MNYRVTKVEREYWSQVAISCAQITFGVFWAALLLSKSPTKFAILLVNGIASIIFWIGGLLLVKK